MTINLTELERLADAATQGLWHVNAGEADAVMCGNVVIAYACISHQQEAADAALIAACSPERIKALVAVVRAAKRAMLGANKEHWDALREALKEFEL